MPEPEVILVDEQDRPTGTMGKLEAHRKAVLHRAFSIFIFNNRGEMLLHQRAAGKYHSGGLWTNACCSHPAPGEDIMTAARRRLVEEMGFETELTKIFDFVYRADLDNGLTEYEFDHVLTGIYDGPVDMNKDEAMDYCFKTAGEIRESLQSHPQKYTAWFRIAFPLVEEWLNRHYDGQMAGRL